MSAIDVQNAKQIRAPMIVNCGIAAQMNVNLTFSNISGFPVIDSNPSVAIDAEEWPVRILTDLQGDGFPADGTCEFYDSTVPGSDDGKVGARTHIGGTGSMRVSAAAEIPALTIYTSGEGTITANGVEYEARGVNVIPVNATTIDLAFTSTDPERRLEVQTIKPGINMSWDNDALIGIELYLRSDLSIKDASWAVSEIQIQAYYPDDISEAISNIGNDVPIWYTAGYPGDMSRQRQFYLSEPATMENNIITIKGVDQSHKLGDDNNSSQVLNTTGGTGKNSLYARFVNVIKNAGIKIQRGASYPSKSSGGSAHTLIVKQCTADAFVQDVMNLAHHGNFWPTFVDAGIPTVYWQKPAAKWDIYEEDCGDVVQEVDRNVAKITTTDENGLHSKAVRSTLVQELTRKNVEMMGRYSYAPGGYWWWLSVVNGFNIVINAEKIAWTAEKTTREIIAVEVDSKTGKVKRTIEHEDQSVVKGKAVAINPETNAVTPTVARSGYTAEMTPVSYGKVYDGGTLLYPNYKYLFERSNITGSFTWKGDPRMQPRDVFRFHRLDGSTELCTISEITLKHDGGTVADIAYRKGVC